MDNLTNILIYIIAVVSLGGLVWIFAKYKINTKTVEAILSVADFITSKVDFKYSTNITTIIKYCFEALDFVNKYAGISDTEPNKETVKKELIKDRAALICTANHVDLEDGLKEIVDLMIDYIVDNKIVKI